MQNLRLCKWTEDIDQLALELPQRHKNLFFKLNERDFHKQIQKLKSNLDSYDNHMILVNIAAIIAMAGDAHTTVAMSITRVIPFEFYWFSEGIYIVASFHKYIDILNCKVTHLNEIPIDEVIQGISRIISHENNSFLKAQLPKYLPAVDVLYGLEIIDEFKQVKLTLQSPDGKVFEVEVPTCEYNEYKSKIIRDIEISEVDLPLYRRNKSKNFWSFFIKEYKTLYFNYSSCKDMKDNSVVNFTISLMKFIDKNDIEKLVIDLRNNLGGDSTLLEPFILDLSKCKKLNRDGGIFVILGRETFSSALLNAYALKNKTKAVFVGEATGGKPNCYGEVQYFDLKNSKLKIRYSTEYYRILEDDEQLSLFPDINIEVTFRDYIDQRDPCIEYILKSQS